MKSKTTFRRTSYIHRKDGINAVVCRDVRPAKKERLPKGMNLHKVSVPPKYEAVLQEMYPDVSIGIAIRKFIMESIDVED